MKWRQNGRKNEEMKMNEEKSEEKIIKTKKIRWRRKKGYVLVADKDFI
jgi:hypothetical protein